MRHLPRARPMPSVEEDIVVNAPIERVYRQWTEYERFPEFMENVKEVRRSGPDMTHWVAEAAGKTVEWDARTIAESQRRVVWTAAGEAGQSGEVRFEPEGDHRTRVRVKMEYTLPSGIQEAAASGLGIDDRAVKRDLRNFKELLEEGER